MTATTIRVQMAQRKDTAANWTAANPILLSGEIGYETDTKKFKIGDGTTNWNSLAYLPIPDGSGNLTITGNLEIGSTGTLTFEGSTADGFETTLAVTDPTADRTITLPDVSGTVVTTGDTGSVTSTMIADGTIVNADVSAAAEIAVSKLANGTANQVLVTDGTDVSWSDDLTLAGNLTVNGTTTTVNTETLVVEDKNIELGVVGTPTDLTADGGGITLKGTTDKTINWIDATDSWTSSEHVDLASGKSYRINGTEVLSGTTLGSGVTGSSLTSVGTISSGTWQGTAIDATYLDSTVVTTGDTGTVTSTMIADGTIVDGDINASAAIAGTKISPNFGSQNVTTTGTATAASFIPTSSTVPTNGVYLPAANSVALSTNGTGRLFIGSDGVISIGATPVLGGNEFTVSSSDTTTIDIVGGTSNLSRLFFSDTTTARGYVNYDHSDDSFRFGTAASERLRITSAGLVGIGTSSPQSALDISANPAVLTINNSSSGITGTDTLLGRIDFRTSDSSQPGVFARIDSVSDATFDGGSPRGMHLLFRTGTVADGAGSPPERVRITKDGRVGIGTTSPNTKFQVANETTTQWSSGLSLAGSTNLNIVAARLDNPDTSITGPETFLNIQAGGSGAAVHSIGVKRTGTGTGDLIFRRNVTGGSAESLRIDTSGRLLVGTSTSTNGGLLQVRTSTTGNERFVSFRNDWNAAGYPAALFLERSFGNGVVANNAYLGAVSWRGHDGTNMITAGSVQCQVDGTPGSNDMPGRLVFSVTADGAASPTEALRISSNRAITVSDGGHIVLGTGTGTKIGTSTSQKIGFFDETPIVQPTTGIAEAAFVENSGGTAVNVDSTFGGYTIQQVVQALQNLGLLA